MIRRGNGLVVWKATAGVVDFDVTEAGFFIVLPAL